MFKHLDGLFAAPFTPMFADGSLNLAVVEDYARKLKKDGVSGVFVCGTTGEGYSLTIEERKRVLLKWLKYQEENFLVMAHVGSTSFQQSAELAEHADTSGAYAIGAMGPSFFQPARTEELVGYCAEIANKAPRIPFYYYHIPSMSGVDLPMKKFLQQASKAIPNFQGIKFTSNNFMEMQQCLMFLDGKYDILHGYDEALLGGLALGVKAAIGSTYNYMAPLYKQLINHYHNGAMEAARELQRYAVSLVEILLKYRGGVVCGKAIQSLSGIKCGPCRLPLQTISEAELSQLQHELEKIQFFHTIKSYE